MRQWKKKKKKNGYRKSQMQDKKREKIGKERRKVVKLKSAERRKRVDEKFAIYKFIRLMNIKKTPVKSVPSTHSLHSRFTLAGVCCPPMLAEIFDSRLPKDHLDCDLVRTFEDVEEEVVEVVRSAREWNITLLARLRREDA